MRTDFEKSCIYGEIAADLSGSGLGQPSPDSPTLDTSEQVNISNLALLKMLKHGRVGVPMEVMGLMLGEFVDEYTVRVVDVFAMPESGTGVSVEVVDHVFQTNMLDMLTQTGSLDAILVDEAVIPKDGAVDIRCGSEIVPGPGGQGFLQYRFTIMPAPESRTQLLKISIDPEHAKCCICLNIWHDVVTAAPCLHNFCNDCFSEWMR